MYCLLHYKCRERNVTNIRYSNSKKKTFSLHVVVCQSGFFKRKTLQGMEMRVVVLCESGLLVLGGLPKLDQILAFAALSTYTQAVLPTVEHQV